MAGSGGSTPVVQYGVTDGLRASVRYRPPLGAVGLLAGVARCDGERVNGFAGRPRPIVAVGGSRSCGTR